MTLKTRLNFNKFFISARKNKTFDANLLDITDEPDKDLDKYYTEFGPDSWTNIIKLPDFNKDKFKEFLDIWAEKIDPNLDKQFYINIYVIKNEIPINLETAGSNELVNDLGRLLKENVGKLKNIPYKSVTDFMNNVVTAMFSILINSDYVDINLLDKLINEMQELNNK